MAKKNLVTIKKIYVDKDDQDDVMPIEEYKAHLIEILYQWYLANKNNTYDTSD